MSYKINVAKSFPNRANGRLVHYFSVEVKTEGKARAREVFEDLKERFPECEVSVTYWELCGRELGDDL